jgi:hypothetical protein
MLYLPPELTSIITEAYLDKEDNANLRLTSKRLSPSATASLFSSVSLDPTDMSIERWDQILKTPHLVNYVRAVHLRTTDDPLVGRTVPRVPDDVIYISSHLF